jgi:hypothetical protein
MRATEQCRQIQQRCLEQDSGMERRVAEVIGSMRVDLEKNILNWERDLYALRDRVRDMCLQTQGIFDERSFTCVYTAYIYATPNNVESPVRLGNRRLHAGEEFVCEPEWFSVDITTHMENAFRATRRETAATSALLGAGVGMLGGAVASGAVGRAVESHRTAQAAKAAEKEQNADALATTPTTPPTTITEVTEEIIEEEVIQQPEQVVEENISPVSAPLQFCDTDDGHDCPHGCHTSGIRCNTCQDICRAPDMECERDQCVPRCEHGRSGNTCNECTQDSHCSGTLICQDNRCVNPPPPSPLGPIENCARNLVMGAPARHLWRNPGQQTRSDETRVGRVTNNNNWALASVTPVPQDYYWNQHCYVCGGQVWNRQRQAQGEGLPAGTIVRPTADNPSNTEWECTTNGWVAR